MLTPNDKARSKAAARREKAKPAEARTLPPAIRFVQSDELPWFPFLADGVHLKLLRVNAASGEILLLIRVDPGTSLAPHYQHGRLVAYTISGRWRYHDAEWEAGPGDAVIQPAGATISFESVGDVPMEAFVHANGAFEFRDERGRILCIENAETLHGRYLAHCALHGISPVDLSAA